MNLYNQNLGDISNDPNVTDTVDSTGMEELTFNIAPKINWFGLALLAAVLYVVLVPDKTKQKHGAAARRTFAKSRRSLSAALKA